MNADRPRVGFQRPQNVRGRQRAQAPQRPKRVNAADGFKRMCKQFFQRGDDGFVLPLVNQSRRRVAMPAVGVRKRGD